jgi:hypothetical protein
VNEWSHTTATLAASANSECSNVLVSIKTNFRATAGVWKIGFPKVRVCVSVYYNEFEGNCRSLENWVFKS